MNSKEGNSGISTFGSRRGEYMRVVQSLLGGHTPEGWEWIHSSSHARVARYLKPGGVYYKEFLRRSLFEDVKNLFRGSRCGRAMLQGNILTQKGFHTPAVLCWGKKGRRHFMITEGINAPGLFDFIRKHWTPPLPRKELHAKRRLIEKLGMEIGRLHKAGICHGDLRLNNILVHHTEKEIGFYFIDNERNRRFAKIPKRCIIKNLVQVNMIFPAYVTMQDRLRFFRAYSRTYPRFTVEGGRHFMQKVQQQTLRRLAARAARPKF